MEQVVEKRKRVTFTEAMKARFKGIFDPIGMFLNRMGVMPNTVTILGLLGNAVGAFLLAQGKMTAGGLVVLAMGPIDALDGTMARLRGETSDFGAFVDSVTDRYSELLIFGGLLFFYLQQGDWLSCLAAYGAAAGSVLVSYIRARGQSLSMDTKIGILTRFERYLVLIPALVFNIANIGMWIIAILANVTALQRIFDVRRQAKLNNKILQKHPRG